MVRDIQYYTVFILYSIVISIQDSAMINWHYVLLIPSAIIDPHPHENRIGVES
jgi:hypothetical protein